MGTAIKHPVPDWVKLAFVIFDIPECQSAQMTKNYKWRLNPVWHRMHFICTHMTTVGVKVLTMHMYILYIHMKNGPRYCGTKSHTVNNKHSYLNTYLNRRTIYNRKESACRKWTGDNLPVR